MKVFINRLPIRDKAWGGGMHFINAFHDYAPEFGIEVVTSLRPDLDAIFMFDPRYDELGISLHEIAMYKKRFPNIKIIHRVNECDARKGTDNDIDPLLQQCSTISSVTVFVSDWLKTYHKSRGWYCRDNRVVYNGVDRDIFKDGKKMDNGKLNIVTHHWSDHWFKGGVTYSWLDEFIGENPEFSFTYIGRHKLHLKNTKTIAPMFGKALGDELGKYDVYVTGTKYDPAPNHVLEVVEYLPVLCHADGGGAVELASENVYRTHADLREMLLNHAFKKNTFVPPTWRETTRQFVEIIKDVK